MFSFHKPKVYRSPTGCCICKAKSSSSRFTDSRKYEQDFLQCFQLAAPRQGEICNACVLLVKRWKKLPAGSSRNWRHVVDARAGPGMKSMVKFKSKNKHLNSDKNVSDDIDNIKKKKHKDLYVKRESSPNLSDDTASDDISGPSSRADSPSIILNSDNEDERSIINQNSENYSSESSIASNSTAVNGRCRIKGFKSRHKSPSLTVSSFLDMTFWKREYVCCGTVFKGPTGELLVDPRFLKPCSSHRKGGNTTKVNSNDSTSSIQVETDSTKSVKITSLKSFSDSSSDSGYDESSNPGQENHHRSENNESSSVIIDPSITAVH